MAAALPLPLRGAATGISKITFSYPELARAVIVGCPSRPSSLVASLYFPFVQGVKEDRDTPL